MVVGESMDALRLFQVLLSVAGISAGQLLLKMAAINLRNPQALGIWIGSYCINVYLVAGISLLGISTLLWIWVLRVLPLSVAYPFMALAFLVVPVLSHFLLGETLGWRNFAGGLLIAAGVVLVSS
jgi:drug/metabolite transporter (DMT)-like permease